MTYYISSSGNDANPGTIGSPFLTFSKAESVVVAGDLVLIDDGTYAGINTTKNGTNNSTRITFQAINEGNVLLSSPIVSSNSFRTYDGFTFNNTSDRAFDILGGNNNFLNITININYGVGYGIKIGMDANVGGSLASNNIINNLRIVSTFVGAQAVHGVLFGGGASGNAIFNSYITNTRYGIVDKVCSGSRVYNCAFNFNIAGLYVCIYSKGSTNGIYIHNVIRTTGNCYGVIMAPSDGGSPQSVGSQILNNIFVKGTDAAIYNAGTGSFTSDYNVFQFTGGALVLDPAGYGSLAAWQATGHDTHSIAATPTFVNASATLTQLTDYKPLSGSPVINAGTTSFRTTDAGGNSVVSVPDIGPWEFQTVGNIYWISTTGNDANSGTSIGSPWLHIEKINTINLLPGDVVNIRAGTYDSYAPLFFSAFNSVAIINKSGTPSAHITIQGYPPDFAGGGAVVYNLLNISRTTGGLGIHVLDCSYIDFWRINVIGPAQESGGGAGTYSACWWFDSGTSKTNITANICEASFAETGFRLDNVNNVTYNNCDAHDIDDPFTGPPTGPHNNSDGFSRTGHGNTATNTVYNFCRAWNCADDGWDCIRTIGSITYNGCWAFHNGYNAANVSLGDGNGFKMGGTITTDGSENASTTVVTRFVTRCLAAGNKTNGFDQNQQVMLAQLYNNSSINNGQNDFKFAYFPERQIHHIFKNNVSFGNAILAGSFLSEYQFWVQANNSWNGIVTLDAGDFASLGPLTELQTARNADGTLPVVAYAHLVLGSDLIDAGVILPIPYNGLAPDLGAFEFGDLLPEPGEPPPVFGTITGLTIDFSVCDPPPVAGYLVSYRVAGDPDWISAGLFMTSPAVITGLSYPVGTVFEAQVETCPCTPVTDPVSVVLPDATVGVPYDFTIDIPGTPTPPVTFTAISVPAWLTIAIVDNLDGTFSIHFTGDPEASVDPLTVHFTVTNDCATIDIDTTLTVVDLSAFIYTITQTAVLGSEPVRNIFIASFDGADHDGFIDWGDGSPLEAFTLVSFFSISKFHDYTLYGGGAGDEFTSVVYFSENVALFGYNDDIGGSLYHETSFWDTTLTNLFLFVQLTGGVVDILNCMPPNPASTVASISMVIHPNSVETTVDLSGIDATLDSVAIQGLFAEPPALTAVTGIPAFINNALTIANLQNLISIQGVGGNLPACQTFSCNNNGNGATVVFDTVNFSVLTTCIIRDDGLSVATINAFLIGLDGNGLTGGFMACKQQVPAVPTGAGATAKANLLAKGWTVDTD